MTTFLFFWGLERAAGAVNMVTTDLLFGVYYHASMSGIYHSAMARVEAL